MRLVLNMFLLSALVAVAGCWTRGSVKVGLPHLDGPLPRGTSIFVVPTQPRLKQALVTALRERGFEVVDAEKAAEFLLKVKILSWEYNEAGFAGPGPRDDMELEIRLVDRVRERVRDKATVSVASDFDILKKYAERLAPKDE